MTPILLSRFIKSTISLPWPLISIYLYGVTSIPVATVLDCSLDIDVLIDNNWSFVDNFVSPFLIPSKSLLDYFFKYNTSKYAFFGISVGLEDEFLNSIYPASVPIVTPFILIFWALSLLYSAQDLIAKAV